MKGVSMMVCRITGQHVWLMCFFILLKRRLEGVTLASAC